MVKVEMVFEKETKNTVKYTAPQGSHIDALYIQKAAGLDPAKKITVVVTQEVE
jgi:hypothetical protein